MVHPKNPAPAWVNPNEVGRKFLKRKSSTLASRRQAEAVHKTPTKQASASRSPLKAAQSPVRSSPRKSFNPFKVPTPSKKRRLGTPSPRKSPRKAGLRSAEKIVDSPKSSRGRFLNFGANKPAPIDFSSLAAEFSLPTKESTARKFLDFSSLNTSSRDEPASSTAKKTYNDIPKDLRPGIRMRLSSFKPFPWTKKRNGASAATVLDVPVDDAIAGRRAVKGVDLEFDSATCLNNLSPMARLEAMGTYYIYPRLNELQLPSFPRLDAQSKMPLATKKPKGVSAQQLGQTGLDGFASQWSQVFHTLFYDWYRGDLRSFYLFAHNTTILFTKYVNLNNSSTYDPTAALNDESTLFGSGQKQHKVIMTPTTSGIRKILRDHAIVFELPLSGKSQRSEAKPNDTVDENTLTQMPEAADKTDDSFSSLKKADLKTPEKKFLAKTTDDLLESPTVNDDAIDNDEWLKEIGISPRSTLGFGRHATIADFSLHSEMSNLGSHHDSPATVQTSEAARSTAVITDGRSIRTLFNFLCTSKDFRATTGPLAGIPPTLVAADSFMNSSRVCLNKTTQTVKKPGESRLEYIIEFDGGPILPHMPAMLTSFIKSVPSLNVKDNKMKITVTGREPYLGFNESIDRDAFVNHSTFVYDPIELTYEV
uniref:Uncharacterized protein n=1 Tax=Panagrellus redivivus TaxID=6233 RepID=A0A7E4W6U6_PANRE